MKTKRVLLSVLVLLQAFLFVSCDKENEDNSIRFYRVASVTGMGVENLEEISAIEVNIGWSGGFYVKGGAGDYKVVAESDECIEVTPHPESKDYYVVTSKKIGSSTIVVTDGNGNQVLFPCAVVSYTRGGYVMGAHFYIDVEEGDIEGLEINFKEYIELILTNRSNDFIGTTFQFDYYGRNTGELLVKHTAHESVKGTFEFLEIEGYAGLQMEYNNQVHTYIRDPRYVVTKDIGPVYDFWVQDLTGEFREKYPDREIKQVAWSFSVLQQR